MLLLKRQISEWQSEAVRYDADAVVMLTWSDWHSEPRSNRYHYATRFARIWPVLFVQPDADTDRWYSERTAYESIVIVHVPAAGHAAQQRAIAEALAEHGVKHPIYWVYNPTFVNFVRSVHSAWKIFHATEDYFAPEFFWEGGDHGIRAQITKLLSHIDLAVAVSDGVARQLRTCGRYAGEMMVLENGCDFEFWSSGARSAELPDRPVALYQGGINARLDYGLIGEVVTALPEWDFVFCGRIDPAVEGAIGALRDKPNVAFLGHLEPDVVRDLCHRASAGIVPFVENAMIAVSLPLKAFEYVACGLPVVSTPIAALQRFPQCFELASGAASFREALRRAVGTRADERRIAERLQIAREQSYDKRFDILMDRLRAGTSAAEPAGPLEPANVLVLRAEGAREPAPYEAEILAWSRHRYFVAPYAGVVQGQIDLSAFDAIVFSCGEESDMHDCMAGGDTERLSGYGGLRIVLGGSLPPGMIERAVRGLRPQVLIYRQDGDGVSGRRFARDFPGLAVVRDDGTSCDSAAKSVIDPWIDASVRRPSRYDFDVAVMAIVDIEEAMVRPVTGVPTVPFDALPKPWSAGHPAAALTIAPNPALAYCSFSARDERSEEQRLEQTMNTIRTSRLAMAIMRRLMWRIRHLATTAKLQRGARQ